MTLVIGQRCDRPEPPDLASGGFFVPAPDHVLRYGNGWIRKAETSRDPTTLEAIMPTAANLRAEADALEAQAQALRAKASEARQRELRAQPLDDRLVYAAYVRCPCGAGMAYDPAGESGKIGNGYWDCSDILRGLAKVDVKHEAKLPFAFYEVKSENQPSASGATTRERAAPKA